MMVTVGFFNSTNFSSADNADAENKVYLLPGQEGQHGPHTDPDPIANFFSDGKFLWSLGGENEMVEAVKVKISIGVQI